MWYLAMLLNDPKYLHSWQYVYAVPMRLGIMTTWCYFYKHNRPCDVIGAPVAHAKQWFLGLYWAYTGPMLTDSWAYAY